MNLSIAVILLVQALILVLFGYLMLLPKERNFFGFQVNRDYYLGLAARRLRQFFVGFLGMVWIIVGLVLVRTGLIHSKIWPTLLYQLLPLAFCFYLWYRVRRNIPQTEDVQTGSFNQGLWQYSLQNSWLEFIAIALILIAVGTLLVTRSALPNLMPIKWNFSGRATQSSPPNLLVFFISIAWALVFVFLSLLSSMDIARISRVSGERTWGVPFVRWQAISRLIIALWLIIYETVLLSAAFNPLQRVTLILLPVTVVQVVILGYGHLQLRKYFSSLATGKFREVLAGSLRILRFRNAFLFILQMLILLCFMGLLIEF
jgi:hypothetical protein